MSAAMIEAYAPGTEVEPIAGQALSPPRLGTLPACEPRPRTHADPAVTRLGFGPDAAAPVRVRRRPGSSGRDTAPAPNSDESTLRAWIGRYVLTVLDIAAGRREPAQVLRWSSPEVYERLRRRHHLHRTLAHPVTTSRTGPCKPAVAQAPALLAIRIDRPAPSVVEAVAVVRQRGRGQAVALRLEPDHGRTKVVTLELI